MKTTTLTSKSLKFLFFSIMSMFVSTHTFAQFPGCPNIDAGPDQTLPCSTPCTNLTATPFATGAPTTYSVGSVPHTPPIAYNAAGGTAVSVGTDDVWSPPITLPFNFCFYGVNYTTINVGSNGAIQFGGGTAGGAFHPWSYTASCPSTALTTAGDVFGVYHDIDPTVAGTVKWYILGTAPCRIFVVSFNNLGHFSCTSLRSTHMMVLYETTNVIDVYVNNKATCGTWNGGRAIIGIQNPAGTAGIAAPGRNAAASWTVTTPEGWRFTPTGAPNYSVAWFQGATQIGTGNTINVCPTATTTYTSVVTYTRCDGTQVTDQDQVTINFSNLPPATVTPTAESCNNYNNGSVIIDNAAGAGPFTVAIAGPASGSVVEPNTAGGTASFTNLPDGNYTYTVTGANGCTTTGAFTIAPGPNCCSVTATSTNILCNGATTGTGTANPVGLAPYTYSWTGGQTSQTASNLGAGSYTVTLTDFSGCTATANITITQPTALSGSLTPVQVTCNGLCNGSVSVSASGGTAPYQYSINGGAYQASNSFTGLCAGAYVITVRDANNCTITLNQTITQPTLLNLAQTAITQATCGANNGSVTVAGSGGTAPYQYSIDGGANQASGTFGSLGAGTHIVQVTDSKGCTKSLTITITSTNSPTASIQSQTNVSCFGGVNGSVIIGVSGGSSPFTYDINPGPSQASNTFTNLIAGTYTVIVTDANGCTSTSPTINITQPAQLTFTSTATAASCNGVCDGQILVNASGGTAPYQYSSNNGTTYQLANPLTGLCAGTISVVIQDANGCLTNNNVTITQPAPVSATFTSTNPICNGACDGTITVTPSGGTPTYQYSVNGGALQASNVITGACGGNNVVLIQDSHGCQFSAIRTLVDPPGFGINQTLVVESNCGFNNGSITVAANGTNGPFTYTMTSPLTTNTTGSFINLFGGAYEITAVDALGCSESVFFGINDVEMDGIVLVQTDATCFGGTDGTIEVQNVSGAPPITYELDNSGATQFSGFFGALNAGSHVVTIYDGGFCVFTIPFTILQPTEIQYDTIITDVACNGGATGGIQFTTVSGGTGAHQYSIDSGTNFQATPSFTNQATGVYDLVVMDANGCMVTGTANIQTAPPLAYTTTVIDLGCNGDNSGGIQIGATGGTGAYQYSINNGASFSPIESFFGLAAGTYTIVVMDAAGCTISGTVTVNEPTPVSATYTPTAALCNGACDGQIVVNASGGTAPYLYSPDNGLNFFVSNTLTGLCAGNVDIRVKDDNDCFINAVQVITEPTLVTFTATPTDETCSAANGQIAFVANGGTPGYTYSINSPATYSATTTFTGLTANTYNVSVKDLNNCIVNGTVTILNNASPVIIGAAVTNVTCNAACNGQIQVTASGGTGALTYSIGTPQAASLITNICAGNYTLTITDQNGCTDTEPVVVTEPAVLTGTVTPTNLTCFNNNTGELTFAANGGTAPYQYSTNNGTSFSNQTLVQFLAAGTYNTVIKDANNCTVNNTVTITEPAVLAINMAKTDATCYGVCDGTATATVTGGTTTYNFTWTSGTTGSNMDNNLCAGSYSVDVVDNNGCTVSGTVTINEPPMLVINSMSTTNASCNTNCDGTVSINSPLAINYSIDNGATFQSANTFNGLCAGTYDVVVQDAAGCPQTSQFVITEPQPLVLNAIPEDGMTICYDGYGTLSGDAVGGTQPYYFIWNTGDTTQYLNVNLTAAASFSCTVVDANGCVSNVQNANVLVRPQFIPSVTTPVYGCPGSPVSMTASGVDGLPNYTFEWLTTNHDTLATGTNFSYIPAGQEQLLMVAHDECYQYDTLVVDVMQYVMPSPVFTPNPASGCSPLDVTFTFPAAVQAQITSATWTFGDGNTGVGTSAQHVYYPVGCYDVSVQITTTDGCVTDTTLSNIVCVVPDPIANFNWNPSQPTTLNSTVTFYDQSTNAATYSWDFGTFGSSSLENPIVNYGTIDPGSQQVCLTVTSPEGCTNQICKNIIFIEEFIIFVPNTFTPDGDEYNNYFKPVVPQGMKLDEYTLLIFDRWGEVLFESHDVNFGWDGTYHNEIVKEGTYIWTITAKGGDDKKSYKLEGHVNMLK